MSRENRKRENFKILLRKLIYPFESLIFPSFCQICHYSLSHSEMLICSNCLRKISPMEDNVCKRCGKPMNSNSPSQICISCIDSPPPFAMHRSFASYEGAMRDLILLIKFKKMKVLAKILTRIAYEHLKDNSSIYDCDLIIPVPISKKRKAERGFNQSEEIARELSKLTKKKIFRNVLIKKFDTLPQSLLSLKERKKNILGSFGVKNGELIKGKRILLVDDIYTSGYTVSECCKVLYRSGAGEVKAFTIARGGTGYFSISLESLDS